MNTEMVTTGTPAAERLEKSRALLRDAMRDKSNDRPPLHEHKLAPKWLTSLISIPVVPVLTEALNSWWGQHPLRVASLLATNTTRAVMQPLAQRNPLGLALGALALGALVAWARPWRWILKRAMFAGLASQLLSKGIAHMPLESWLDALMSVAFKKSPASTNKRVER